MSREKYVNIAVCGKFHVLNYVAYLEQAKVLNRVYFSHKGQTAARYNISPEVAFNYPLKEFLIQAHGRVLGPKYSETLWPIYDSIWESTVRRHWSSTPIFHMVANGNCLSLAERAKAEGAQIVADVVITHPSNRREVIAREAKIWGCDVPSVALPENEKRILREVELADVLLVPTRTVGRTFATRGFSKRTETLPFASNLKRFYVDEAAFEERRKRTGPVKVVSVGQIGLRKGQLYLLEAARKLGIQVTLVGMIAPGMKPLLDKYADTFTHVENVPNDQMRDFLHGFDVFAFPSLEEGLAYVLGESMACGLAVVTTNEAGGEEVIQNGKTGTLVEAGSVDALVEGLKPFLENRAKVVETGERAAESTRSHHNWEQYAGKLHNIYESMLAAKGDQ